MKQLLALLAIFTLLIIGCNKFMPSETKLNNQTIITSEQNNSYNKLDNKTPQNISVDITGHELIESQESENTTETPGSDTTEKENENNSGEKQVEEIVLEAFHSEIIHISGVPGEVLTTEHEESTETENEELQTNN